MTLVNLISNLFVWLMAGGSTMLVIALVMACYEWNMGAQAYPPGGEQP